jgi:hypothetical protein
MLATGLFLLHLSLGAWLGAVVLLSFVVAPTVFRTMKPAPPSNFLRVLFRRYYKLWEWLALMFAAGAGLTWLAAGDALPPMEFALAAGLAALCAGIGAYSGRVLTPALDAVRGKDRPVFNRLHKRSVRLNAVALFALMGAIFLVVRIGSAVHLREKPATVRSAAAESQQADS